MVDSENRILLIIDSLDIARYLTDQLVNEGSYPVSIETTAEQAVVAFKQTNYSLVIINLTMPGIDPVALVKQLKDINPDAVCVAYSEKNAPEVIDEVNRAGFYDVISKPINLKRMFFVIKRSMELHATLFSFRRLSGILKEQNGSLQKQNIMLAKRIEEATVNLTRLYEDLRSTYMRTIRALAHAIDARDHYTHSHSENVSRYAERIAKELGLSIKEVEIVYEASQLHDIGKIGISDGILTKPEALNPQEWEIIKLHPQLGAQILEPLTFLNDVIELVRQHHEHFDGTGYPAGKKSEEILLGARIIHLADAYDAMTSARSYRRVPFTREQAVVEIQQHSNTQFDPRVVMAFLRILDEL